MIERTLRDANRRVTVLVYNATGRIGIQVQNPEADPSDPSELYFTLTRDEATALLWALDKEL